MRVAIMKSDGSIDSKIKRVLMQNKIDGDFIKKWSTNSSGQFDVIIFSHQNKIQNLPKIIESIVLQEKILVLYINNTLSVGQFYNVLKDKYFNVINEQFLDIELPCIIDISVKYLSEINCLQMEKSALSKQINDIQMTNFAKRILIEKGYTEADSHKFIQKKAMDLRKSRESIVNLIIENKIDF